MNSDILGEGLTYSTLMLMANDANFARQLGIDQKDPAQMQKIVNALKSLEMVATGVEQKTPAELAQLGLTAADKREYSFLDPQSNVAADTAYAAGPMGQFEFFDPRFYEFKYKKTNFRDLFPVKTQGDPADEISSYVIEELVGVSDTSGDATNTHAKYDITEKKDSVPIVKKEVEFEVTIEDLLKAAKSGRPIESRKIRAAQVGSEQTMHDIVVIGSPEDNINGFITHPEIIEHEVAGATASAKLWANKSPEDILNGDLGEDLIGLISELTFGHHSPTDLGLSFNRYNYLRFNWITSAVAPHPISLLQWLTEQLETYGIQRITPMVELAAAGPGGLELGIAWENNDDVLEVDNTVPLTWLPPQFVGTVIKFFGYFKISGMKIRRKQAVRRFYGF